MARFEISGPDGARYEVTAPDGVSEQEVLRTFHQSQTQAPAIDFNRPDDQVRADIGKLQGEQRKQALDKWADSYVEKERKQGGVAGVAQAFNDRLIRPVARGTFVGPFLDELTAMTSSLPRDEVLAYQRAKDRAEDQANPVTSTALKVAGGVAGGVGAYRAGGGLMGMAVGGPLGTMAPAASLPGRMAQGVGAGAIYGGASGYGNAEGDPGQRLEAAQGSAIAGGMVGGVLPPVIQGAGAGLGYLREKASPLMARYAQEAQNRNIPGFRPEQKAHSLSAAAADEGLPAITGADAAAEQMIANQLSRAGVSAREMRARLGAANEAATFGSNSRAQQMLAPADLDPSLARLAGSAGRQQPEAYNLMKSFQDARQTGQTPKGITGREMAERGLPTRDSLAAPLTGAQAERSLGRRFGTQPGDNVPMGQFERIRDGLKRAFRIEESRAHGHGKNAHRTDESIIQAAKEEAKELYSAYYKAGDGIDMKPSVVPVLEKWKTALIDEPSPVSRKLRSAMREVQRALAPGGVKSHAERLDKVKQQLDDEIDTAFTSTNARQRYLGGKLTEFKNELIDAIGAVKTNDVGDKYAAARAAFESRMKAREALQLGRDVFKDDSDIAVDQIAAVAEPGLQKLLRLGMLDGFEKLGARRARTDDVTKMFQTPRMQEILRAAIPKSEKASDVFANRPERFGAFVGNERSMLETRNVSLGGSSTARNLEDDKAYNGLSAAVERMRSSGSLVNVGIEAVSTALNKMFGMRADTAAALAQKLFTADPNQRQQLLNNLERRMGKNRAEQMARMLNEYQRQFTQAGATVGGGSAQ